MEQCIRENADLVQLRRCKEELSRIQNELSSNSKTMALAGNEVRLKILYLLVNENKMCPCDLSDVIGLSVPAISQHLRKLKDAELVVSKKTGQTVLYSLHSANTRFIMPLIQFGVSSHIEQSI